MKLNCLIGLQLLLALARCLKNNCWPSLPLLDCIDGWKEMDVDTTYLTSDVVMGNYIGTDTIVISIKYGYLMGSYNKYQIVGVRTR